MPSRGQMPKSDHLQSRTSHQVSGYNRLSAPTRYPAGTAREGVAHPRVWLNPGPGTSYLAVVTDTGAARSATESAGRIWAMLAGRFGPSLVLLEHPGSGRRRCPTCLIACNAVAAAKPRAARR